jgi:transcriptional regulator with XRE-family HTH domain
MYKLKMGKRIEKIRKTKVMNQAQFARFLGMTPQNLSEIEKGKKGLSIETLINICVKCRISSDYILFGKTISTRDEIANILKGVTEENIEYFAETLKSVAKYCKKSVS